jgi:hypothetical protein
MLGNNTATPPFHRMHSSVSGRAAKWKGHHNELFFDASLLFNSIKLLKAVVPGKSLFIT